MAPAQDGSADEVPLEGTLAFLNVRGEIDAAAARRAIAGRRGSEDASSAAVRLGIVDANAVRGALDGVFGWDELMQLPLDPALTSGLDVEQLEQAGVYPLHRSGRKLFVLCREGADAATQRRLRYELRARVLRTVSVEPKVFARFVAAAAKGELAGPKPAGGGSRFAKSGAGGTTSGSFLDLAAAAQGGPALAALARILARAFEVGASDVHLEPQEDALRVRLRRDGLLVDSELLPDTLARPIANAIKINAKLRVDVDFQPQDGRLTVVHQGEERSLRVSVLPSLLGQSVVLRVLAGKKRIPPLASRGLDPKIVQAFRRLCLQPSGILLVVGPTGSGKSSTLFSALNEVNTPERKIVTLEDPIEYTLPNIVQSAVDTKRGVTFADGLRALLRHDPEVILLGEMRDKASAEVAIEAALTGHLVMSSLHTNDAPRAVTRLLDMGIDTYLIEESLLGVLSQRLIRTLCEQCRVRAAATEDEARALGVAANRELYHADPSGCAACGGTGYAGRTGVFEFLVATPEVRACIRREASSDAIRKAARASGMRTVWEDGVRKVLAGRTTTEELQRVLGLNQEQLDLETAGVADDAAAMAMSLTWTPGSAVGDEIRSALAAAGAERPAAASPAPPPRPRPAGGAPRALAGRSFGRSPGAPSGAPPAAGSAILNDSDFGRVPLPPGPAPAPVGSDLDRELTARLGSGAADDAVLTARLPAGSTASAASAAAAAESAPGASPEGRIDALRRSGRIADALSELDALGAAAKRGAGLVLRALLSERAHDAPGARAAYAALAERGAGAAGLLGRAVLAYEGQDDAGALAAIDQALTDAAGVPLAELRTWRARILGSAGRWPEAFAEVARAVGSEPDDPGHRERRAELLADADRPADAVVAYAEAIQRGAVTGTPQLERARLLARLGRNDEALIDFDTAAEALDGDPALHYERACVLQNLGRLAEAATALERSVTLAPAEWYYGCCLVAVRVQLGQVDAAQSELERLEPLCAGHPEAQTTLQRVRGLLP